jgi:hypothetical protein
VITTSTVDEIASPSVNMYCTYCEIDRNK